MDSFSPLSAARLLVQVLPVGPRVASELFLQSLKRLQSAGCIRLQDIAPPSDPERNGFSPLRFPRGKISFCFTPSAKSLSHAVLYPFETFREPFIVLGLADQSQFDLPGVENDGGSADPSVSKRPLADLKDSLAELRENYPNALVHRLLLAGAQSSLSLSSISDDVVLLGPTTNVQALLCDLSALLLPEMGGLAKSFQALQKYHSPLSQNQERLDDLAFESSGSAGTRGSSRSGLSPSSPSPDFKASHRMSMPAHLMSSASPGPMNSSRPGIPTGDGRSTPATTLDSTTGSANSNARIATPPANSFQHLGSDRNSAVAFGSGPLSERNRMKQQGRLGCIVGGLYLQCGIWGEAFRELADSAAKTRLSSDHLWHAKALENLTTCMLLLATHSARFKIPDIFYAASNRPLAARSTQLTPTGSVTDMPPSTPDEAIQAIKGLYETLPELVNMTRETYQRTLEIPGEDLPEFAYSEMNVRFARLLISLSDRDLMDEEMRQLLHGDPQLMLPKLNRGKTFLRRVNDILQHAIPQPSDVLDMSLTDTVSILGAVAASYSALGMARKSSLVLQDFLDCLVPGLVQALKVGAAEAGMHPAAGIANLQSQPQQPNTGGMRPDDILGFFECLGIMPVKSEKGKYMEDEPRTAGGLLLNTEANINLLRRCIRVCEALPDFEGILKCTEHLFALVGPQSAPPLAQPDVSILLSPDEQKILSGNFYRTSDLMDNLGLIKKGGNYWDPFLVRGIEVQSPPPSREMIPQRMADFEKGMGQRSVVRGPFLHDPFAQKAKGSSNKPVLVVGDLCTFSLTLQNLFDFRVCIDSVELITNMDDFVARAEGIRISPRCVQIFAISGQLKSAGSLRITGCKVNAKACNEKIFEIIPGPWFPQKPLKIGSTPQKSTQTSEAPKPFVLEATVLERQPLLTITELSFSQRAIDLMEGERRRIRLALMNRSTSATINFLRITPQDNLKMYFQSALKDRDLQPTLRHEMERQVFQQPVLRCISGEAEKTYDPEKTVAFELEILGKPGLTHAAIQIDYASLADTTTTESFFSRIVDIPFTVGVKPAMRLLSCHIAPLPQDPMGVLGSRASNVWMTLDFKNHSSTSLKLSFQQKRDRLPAQKWLQAEAAQKDLILPGRLTTLSLPVPKLRISDRHAPIPSLDPTKERQFVLRQSGGAPVDERAERERFWFSAALIDSLSATWIDPDSGRSGSVNLHDISLSNEDVELLRLDEISITWVSDIVGGIGEISTAKLRVSNESREAVRVDVQLYRTIEGFGDRVAGCHVETQLLSVLKPESETEVAIDVTFENKGRHVFVPSVVEREAGDGDVGRETRTWRGEEKYVTVR